MFRVCGSPYTSMLHQHVTYLRLKRLPFKVYCSHQLTTLLSSLYYRARFFFCTVTPSGTSCTTLWQLVEATELDEVVVSGSSDAPPSSCDTSSTVQPASPLPSVPIMLSSRTHPQLHLAMWCTAVYGSWWLAKTGAMYRWVLGDSSETLEGYLRYVVLPFPGRDTLARLAAPTFKRAMCEQMAKTGITREISPYMDEHFKKLCAVLNAHFEQQSGEYFLLGTPHPTLADVVLGASFSSSFLSTNSPAAMVAEPYPFLLAYVERVTGWRGGVFEDTVFDVASTCYPDVVPESLSGFFELMIEVFPFIMSQCHSFNTYLTSDAMKTLTRVPLEAPWEGCHGYLFPLLSGAKSLMIVDDVVLTVQVRSQDLEIALLAAREVLDTSLLDFGRVDMDATPQSAEMKDVHTTPMTTTTTTSEGQPVNTCDKENKSLLREEGTCNDVDAFTSLEAQQEEEEEESSSFLEPLLTEYHGRLIQDGSPETITAELADFYRVLSKSTQKRYSTLQQSGAKLKGRQPGIVCSVPVRDHLRVLHHMLEMMHCPQYTVTSVFQGRKLLVAAIPEYEVARKRAKRMEAAHDAASS